MKVFPKLAQKTDLSTDEIKVFFYIRFGYVQPLEYEKYSETLVKMCLALLSAGKVKFEIEDHEAFTEAVDFS